MNTYPKFAVVGHPNKGKSSIVSTLCMNDEITISKIPGTTTKSRSFPLKVDGKIIYELYDTPGFQNPRRILEWLKTEDVSAHRKSQRIKSFVDEFADDVKYKDDIELLKPILSGAGIIYIVDGSKPYGSEFEVEMEILRYCGAPSMAIINTIGEKDFTKDWENALTHYFKMVRIFNPMKANFPQIIELLKSMSHMNEKWIKPIEEALEILKNNRVSNIKQTSQIIAQIIYKIINYRYSVNYNDSNKEIMRQKAINVYKKNIDKMEQDAFKEILSVWRHKNIKLNNYNNILADIELFSKESISLFGLDKKSIVALSASTGAGMGGGVDILSAGGSLGAGVLIGGVLGGVAGIIGVNKVLDDRLISFLGKKQITLGPLKDTQLLFVVLYRLLFFSIEIAQRPHANRKDVEINSSLKDELKITSDLKKDINKLHKKLYKSDKYKKEYSELLFEYLKKELKS